jgi:hypothetical protein
MSNQIDKQPQDHNQAYRTYEATTISQPISACYSRTSISLVCFSLSSHPLQKTSQKPSLPTTRRRPRRRLYQRRQDEVSQNSPGILDPESTLLSRFGGLAPRGWEQDHSQRSPTAAWSDLGGRGVRGHALPCPWLSSSPWVSHRDVTGLDGTVGFLVV